MRAPSIMINGVMLKDDQAMAIALAIRHFLDTVNTDIDLRKKCEGLADSIEADLEAVMVTFGESLTAQ